jgi:hypothetical protein
MAVSCSLFFILFLIVFLPFGVNEPKKEFNLVFMFQMSLFGIFMFIVFSLNELLLRKKLNIKWTTQKFIYWIIWIFLVVGTANFMLYNYLQSWYDFYLSSYLVHVLNVSSVLVFPIAGTFYYFNHQKMKENLLRLKKVKENNSSLEMKVSFRGESPKEMISLAIKQVLFLEADDNYVNIYYLDNGKTIRHIMRNTLSNIEKQDYPISFLIRTHRSFLVNKYLVQKLKGNVHKSAIKIQHVEDYLPVSRSYIHSVRNTLAEK